MSSLPITILTFNCGRQPADPSVLAGYLIHALKERPESSRATPPAVLALSLQEVAPIAHSFLGGSLLAPYLTRFRAAVDQLGARWPQTTAQAGDAEGTNPPSYTLIAAHNVGMTALLVYARSDIAGHIRNVGAGGVGVGWWEMGNKGAVGVRLTYDPATSTGDDEAVELTFLAAHLAPMEWNCERRNLDWQRVVEGTVFTSHGKKAADLVSAPGAEDEEPLLQQDGGDVPAKQQQQRQTPSEAGIYDTSSWVFVAGDLNYRTSDEAPTDQDSASFKTLKGLSDAKDVQMVARLQSRDQLSRERKAGRTLHGFQELGLAFPPTYKHSTDARKAAEKIEEEAKKRPAPENSESEQDALLQDADSGVWAWSTHRWPSWCDRVLFWAGSRAGGVDESAGELMKTLKSAVYDSLPLMATSDHQPVLLAFDLPLPGKGNESGTTEEETAEKPTPYSINPHWRSRRAVARWKEIVVGIMAYLALTGEGNSLVVATVVGALGGWAVIHALVE